MRALLVLCLVFTISGCALNLGKMSVPQTTDAAPGAMTETCSGLTFVFGDASACGAEGGTISMPGVKAFGELLCAAQTGFLIAIGRTPPECAMGVE